MNTPQDGGPAFPVAIMGRLADGQPMTGYDFGVQGMSLRDWFAGMALQGYMAYSHPDSVMGTFPKVSAKVAYQCADEMLAARERKEDA